MSRSKKNPKKKKKPETALAARDESLAAQPQLLASLDTVPTEIQRQIMTHLLPKAFPMSLTGLPPDYNGRGLELRMLMLTSKSIGQVATDVFYSNTIIDFTLVHEGLNTLPDVNTRKLLGFRGRLTWSAPELASRNKFCVNRFDPFQRNSLHESLRNCHYIFVFLRRRLMLEVSKPRHMWSTTDKAFYANAKYLVRALNTCLFRAKITLKIQCSPEYLERAMILENRVWLETLLEPFSDLRGAQLQIRFVYYPPGLQEQIMGFEGTWIEEYVRDLQELVGADSKEKAGAELRCIAS